MGDNLLFDASFYNDEHEKVLVKSSIGSRLKKIEEDGISIPYSTFLSYAIFHQQSDDEGYATFKELQLQLKDYLRAYENTYGVHQGTVFLHRPRAKTQAKPYTEMGGVGAALAVASELYGLTEADWQRIPESGEHTLDFRIGANNSTVVEVEAKGHAVGNTANRGNISADAAHIADKKRDQRLQPIVKSAEFIGLVTHFPTGPSQRPRVWMLDPEAVDIKIEPSKLRLMKRIYFYWKAIGTISGSALIPALANRFYAITRSKDYDSLDGLPLLGRTGKRMEPSASLRTSKSNVAELDAFGEVIEVDDGKFFFYGFRHDVVRMLIGQRFSLIREYSNRANEPKEMAFNAVLHSRNFLEGEGRVKEGTAMRVRSSGKLESTPSGRVFGWVTPNFKEATIVKAALLQEE